jgi:hypothetical protein
MKKALEQRDQEETRSKADKEKIKLEAKKENEDIFVAGKYLKDWDHENKIAYWTPALHFNHH